MSDDFTLCAFDETLISPPFDCVIKNSICALATFYLCNQQWSGRKCNFEGVQKIHFTALLNQTTPAHSALKGETSTHIKRAHNLPCHKVPSSP
jgi:hypothetical protein